MLLDWIPKRVKHKESGRKCVYEQLKTFTFLYAGTSLHTKFNLYNVQKIIIINSRFAEFVLISELVKDSFYLLFLKIISIVFPDCYNFCNYCEAILSACVKSAIKMLFLFPSFPLNHIQKHWYLHCKTG